MALLVGEAEKEVQLLQSEIGAAEMGPAVARVGRLDQRFENVERGGLDAITEQKALLAGKRATVGISQLMS